MDRLARGRRRLAYEVRSLLGPGAEKTPLAVAAAAGETVLVERLLDEGGDPNAQDRFGFSALHHAVSRGHTDTAATLLARGADPRVANRGGNTPLSLRFTTREVLHGVRQRYHRLADRLPAPPASRSATAWANQLAHDGIVRVSGLITPEALARMQCGFERFVAGIDARLAAGSGLFQRWEE